jgi:hypothetical protein
MGDTPVFFLHRAAPALRSLRALQRYTLPSARKRALKF